MAFASEERGLLGSRHFVKKLSDEERKSIRAFVNLECLGLTPVKVWARRSDPQLMEWLDQLARLMTIPMTGMNVDKVGDDDTHPFLFARIPVVSIHSISQQTYPILHTGRDRLDAVNMQDYYAAFRLVAYYLAYLDLKVSE